MASTNPSFILLLSLSTVFLIIKSSHADEYCPSQSGGKISTYWGQGRNSGNEGTLTEACDTGLYNIVILEYLHLSNGGRTPSLNLEGHCPQGDCTKLESEIKHCQSKDIQVLLSIELDTSSTKSLSSNEDVANQLATYLFNNFLSNKLGPLGYVALDGIDIANFGYSETLRWDDLVRAINASTEERKIYLSAAPHCDHHNKGLDSAIATGLFDYIWVVYYNNYSPCEYLNEDASKLLISWKEWTSSVLANNSVFLGVPASSDTSDVSSGYIPPEVLISDIVPTIKKASNYGGVMIWDRYYDKQTNFSGKIKDSLSPKVCKCVCDGDEPVSRSFYGLLSQFL